MKELGYKIDNSLFSNHKKISDLLYYEGPILSHFTNDLQENYLYYWIDHDETAYRWLIFKVELSDLEQYLYGRTSLRELIVSTKHQFLFIGDINYQGDAQLTNTTIIENRHLVEGYLPLTDSYYSFSVPPLYESLFDPKFIREAEYLSLLKEKGFMIKLASTEILHRHTLTIDDISTFINSIKSSYRSYISHSFDQAFRKLFIDLKDLNKTIGIIQDNLQLRLVDVKLASFGIALSADTIMMSDGLRQEIKEWSNEVVQDFKNEVVELDYTNQANLDSLIQNYSVEARRSIFKPMLDIYADPKYDVSVGQQNFSEVRRLKRLSKQTVKQLTDLPIEIQANRPPQTEFITIAVEVEKGTELENIPKRKFTSQPLFENRSSSIDITKSRLEIDDKTVLLKAPLLFNVVATNDGTHLVSSKEADLQVTNIDITSAIDEISRTFLDAWISYQQCILNKQEVPQDILRIARLIQDVSMT